MYSWVMSSQGDSSMLCSVLMDWVLVFLQCRGLSTLCCIYCMVCVWEFCSWDEPVFFFWVYGWVWSTLGCRVWRNKLNNVAYAVQCSKECSVLYIKSHGPYTSCKENIPQLDNFIYNMYSQNFNYAKGLEWKCIFLKSHLCLQKLHM